METTEILEEARGLLLRGWCQEAACRGADDTPSWVGDSGVEPVAWSSVGAVEQVLLDNGLPLWHQEVFDLLGALAVERGVDPLSEDLELYWAAIRFNDEPGRTLTEVLSLYDEAIQRAKNG